MPSDRINPATAVPPLRASLAACLLSGLVSVVAPPAVMAQSAPLTRDTIAAHVAEAAQRFGIPAAWLRAVMRQESGGDRHAVSPKGAMGLMQIMPATWASLRVRHSLGADPYDARDNILAGAAYLREMFDRYGASGFLAAYNAGPGRYEDALSGRRALPSETRAYVAALTPVVSGAAAAAPLRLTAVDPLSWTRASLFAARSNRSQAVDPAQSEDRATDTPSASTVRDVSAIVPQSNGLFVARSGAGDAR